MPTTPPAGYPARLHISQGDGEYVLILVMEQPEDQHLADSLLEVAFTAHDGLPVTVVPHVYSEADTNSSELVSATLERR